jgi:hypothetical protein
MKARFYYLGKRMEKHHRPLFGYIPFRYLKTVTSKDYNIEHCFYIWRFAFLIKFW